VKIDWIVLLVAVLVVSSGCSTVGFLVANAPTHFGTFNATTGLEYGKDPRQRLDVYAPRNARNCPVVIFFYGGSWQWGDRSNYRFIGTVLAARGILTVIPDYRLYPQVRYPSFVEDGANAVAWAHQHVRAFGGNPDKLVLMGHSAGGQIAAMLAEDDSFLEHAGVSPQAIAGLVGLSGTYVLVPDDAALRAIFSSPYTAQQWQPVSFVSDHSPPTLLVHGSDDTEVYPVEAVEMIDALHRHHIEAQLYLYPGRGHSDTVASFSLAARSRTPALQQTIDFVQKVTSEQ
jgi:acetyl esterase/lipase